MRLNLDHVHGVPINKDLSEVKYKLFLVHGDAYCPRGKMFSSARVEN